MTDNNFENVIYTVENAGNGCLWIILIFTSIIISTIIF